MSRTADELKAAGKSAGWKLAPAAALKARSKATNRWLSTAAHFGNLHEVSRKVSASARAPDAALRKKFGLTQKVMRNVPHFHPRADRRKLTPRELCRLKKTREEWYADLEPTASFQRLFDHIPGLHFFAKDKEGRTMFCSRSILALHHMKSESEMLGLTDYDLNPSPNFSQ